ncbi:MAG: BON domain-containing protein [Pseudomonadota bacterium]
MRMRAVTVLGMAILLGGCAAGSMMGAGQGGRAEDGRSYEEARTDNLLAAAVNRALVRDKGVSAGDIRVSTRDGVVTLDGVVASAEVAARVVRLVRDTAGVRDVVDQLRIAR